MEPAAPESVSKTDLRRYKSYFRFLFSQSTSPPKQIWLRKTVRNLCLLKLQPQSGSPCTGGGNLCQMPTHKCLSAESVAHDHFLGADILPAHTGSVCNWQGLAGLEIEPFMKKGCLFLVLPLASSITMEKAFSHLLLNFPHTQKEI